MEIRYLKEAEKDIRDSISWLEDRSPRTAERFREELAAWIGEISRPPDFGFPAMKTLPRPIATTTSERSCGWSSSATMPATLPAA